MSDANRNCCTVWTLYSMNVRSLVRNYAGGITYRVQNSWAVFMFSFWLRNYRIGVSELLTILRHRNCSITFDLTVLQVSTLVTDFTACINITNLCIVSTNNNYVLGIVFTKQTPLNSLCNKDPVCTSCHVGPEYISFRWLNCSLPTVSDFLVRLSIKTVPIQWQLGYI
jgi:hypothetical protein